MAAGVAMVMMMVKRRGALGSKNVFFDITRLKIFRFFLRMKEYKKMGRRKNG